MRFRSFPLRLQFLTIPVILLIIISIFSYYYMNSGKLALLIIQNEVSYDMGISLKINTLHKAISNNYKDISHLIYNSNLNKEQIGKVSNNLLLNVEELENRIKQKNFSEEFRLNHREYKKLIFLFKEYKYAVNMALTLNKNSDINLVFNRTYEVSSKFHLLNLNFFAIYQSLRDRITKNLIKKENTLKNFNKKIIYDLIIVFTSILLLSFILSNFLVKHILELINYMGDLSNEKLLYNEKEIPSIYRTDELGQMAQAIWHFKKNIMQLKREISKRKEMEKRLKLSSAIFEKSNEGFVITDKNMKILKVNKRLEQISGFSQAQLKGKTPSIFQSRLHEKDFYKKIWYNLENKNNNYWMGEIYDKRADGTIYPVLLKIYALRNFHGKVTNYIGMFTDLSKIKKSQENIYYLSNYDFLTSIPNRNYFKKELHNRILTKKHFALIFVGLDRFKYINDSLGYSIGDEVLKVVAIRIKKIVKKEIFLARIRGEEFALIFDCIKDSTHCREYASKIIDKILDLIVYPMKVGKYELIMNASAGMSIFPIDCDSEEEILKATNTALQQSKSTHKNSLTLFTKEMAKDSKRKFLIDKSLQESVDLKDIECHFQPIIDAQTREIAGFEALSRWNHEKLGFISPEFFIPIAEENGVIIQLTKKILLTACQSVAYWNKKFNQNFFISVNFSPANLIQNDLIDMIENVLYQTRLPSQLLKIEITENLFLEHNSTLQKKLDYLKKIDVNLSIDDFGTGYSSMQYLKSYPITNLKIDRSFIFNVPEDKYNSGICSAILNLAKGINIEVIAEGVEEEQNAKFLQESGCNYLQGYLFSKALNHTDCEKYIESNIKQMKSVKKK